MYGIRRITRLSGHAQFQTRSQVYNRIIGMSCPVGWPSLVSSGLHPNGDPQLSPSGNRRHHSTFKDCFFRRFNTLSQITLVRWPAVWVNGRPHMSRMACSRVFRLFTWALHIKTNSIESQAQHCHFCDVAGSHFLRPP